MNQALTSKLVCDHCLLPMIQEEAIIHDAAAFCCHGCKGAWDMIHAAGLASYYEKREPTPGLAVSLPDLLPESANFTATEFQETQSTQLLITGIHCAACVWLNEAYLLKLDGVISAKVNYSNHRATIEWEPAKTDLATIIHALASLGYRAMYYDPQQSEKMLASQRLLDYRRFILGLFAMMNIMWLAIAEWAGYFSGMEQNVKDLLHLAQFTLATPVVFYSGKPFFTGAIAGLKNGILGLDFQIAFSTFLIWGYSSYASVTQTGRPYFESAVMLITFVLGGKFIERISLKNIYEFSSHLGNHLKGFATRIEKNQRSQIAAVSIEIGWVLEAKAGERILADGIIAQGASDFDESFLTGESKAQFKNQGGEVLASSLNLSGLVQYRVTKKPDESVAAKIADLVDLATNSKPPMQQRADKIARVFVPLVLVLATLNGWIWGWHEGNFEAGLIQFIALLVIACPCALSLATPIAYLIGIKEAAKKGILFRKASVIEDLSQAEELYLDKTGTLTEGKPKVIQTWGESHGPLLFEMVSGSHHPLSRAIVDFLPKSTELQGLGLEEIAGRGLRAEHKGQNYFLGSLDWLKEVCELPDEARVFANQQLELGRSLVAYGKSEVKVIFSLEDQIKPDLNLTLQKLKEQGLNLSLLSGDAKAPSEAVAGKVGIKNVIAPSSPEAKLEVICEAQKRGPVIMVGDGINDSPALVQADVGISIGCGTQTAIAASDLVLLGDDLKGLFQARVIASKVGRLVKQNLGISLGYNILALSLAFLGLVNPPLAAAAMSLSSLLVVGNAWFFGGTQFR